MFLLYILQEYKKKLYQYYQHQNYSYEALLIIYLEL